MPRARSSCDSTSSCCSPVSRRACSAGKREETLFTARGPVGCPRRVHRRAVCCVRRHGGSHLAAQPRVVDERGASQQRAGAVPPLGALAQAVPLLKHDSCQHGRRKVELGRDGDEVRAALVPLRDRGRLGAVPAHARFGRRDEPRCADGEERLVAQAERRVGRQRHRVAGRAALGGGTQVRRVRARHASSHRHLQKRRPGVRTFCGVWYRRPQPTSRPYPPPTKKMERG